MVRDRLVLAYRGHVFICDVCGGLFRYALLPRCVYPADATRVVNCFQPAVIKGSFTFVILSDGGLIPL